MTTREPYRSPFWRPENAGGVADYFGAAKSRTPTAPAEVAPRAAAPRPDRPQGYSAHDLAMFEHLMAFKQTALHPSPAAAPSAAARGHDKPAPAAPIQGFTSNDLKAFRALQSEYASATAGSPARAAAPAASPRDRGYSARDLKQFDQLTKFDAR